MKKLALILAAALLLTSCGSSSDESPASTQKYVPSECATTKILAALPDSIPNPQYIDTQWEPAEGTDLFASLNAGGLACSYGIQEAEIGTTILWAPDDDTLFQSRISGWTEGKQVKTDLPNIDESDAYVLSEGDATSVERHVWAINLLVDGFWIQVNATFLQTIEEAIPLIEAAINSLRTEEEFSATNVTGCFAATLGNDLLVLNLDHEDRNLVFAKVGFLWSEKPQTEGFMVASYRNQILSGTYEYKLNDKDQQRELFFKGDKSGFIPGAKSKTSQFTWDESVKYVPSDKCS